MKPLRNFGFLLKDVSRLYVRRFEERARVLGFTLPQCKALVHLARNEGITQAQLADLTEIEPMTLVRILDHMEAQGWLERRAAANDRRVRCLFLKPEARPVVEDMWAVSDATRGEALAEIPESEAVHLIGLLEQIRTNILTLAPMAVVAPGRRRAPGSAKRDATRRESLRGPQR